MNDTQPQAPVRRRKPRNSMRRYQLYFALGLIVLVAFICIFVFIYYVPAQATLLYGPPAGHLSISDRIEYSTRLLSHGIELTTPLNVNGLEQSFRVEPGESVASIANRLEGLGIISSADAFFDYAVYTGIDLTIQSGDFNLSPAQSIVDIAQSLQKFNPSDAVLSILPGWRIEEIAASLPTSGLSIAPETFLAAAQTPPQVLAFAAPTTMEGFFFPDTYTLPRTTTVDQLLDVVARNFTTKLTTDIQNGFAAQNLSVYQGVILASIVQREAVKIEEAPVIASVYLNRISIGMKLDADPTVQYALGYQFDNGSWWKSPLALTDLEVISPYNTYLNNSLPPTPISSPGLEALMAVAYPQSTPYYYFQAACDGSGYHVFVVTYEEQIANGCQ
ncbi:MAG TPA: endolytic transglycosylase MltG [Anaerolineales bacterium]|nr:endolytic transglycosylase MltG [Anaerolineales bacterium]